MTLEVAASAVEDCMHECVVMNEAIWVSYNAFYSLEQNSDQNLL